MVHNLFAWYRIKRLIYNMVTIAKFFAGVFDILMILAVCDVIFVKQEVRNPVYWFCFIGAILNFVFICSMWL